MVLVLRTVAVITFAILFAGGCVFYPKKVEYYEGDCDIQVRKLTLESEQMQGGCTGGNNSGDNAKACLVLVLAVSASSAIISGSIVVVGNVVYWLEKQGKCIAKAKW